MRFLIDRCAGRRVAESLRDEGHDVVEVRELGADPGDRRILELAAEESRVLVTMDKDFGAFIAAGSEHAGLLRLPDVPAAARIALLRTVLARHSDDLAAGTVVTVRGERIRVSRFHASSSDLSVDSDRGSPPAPPTPPSRRRY